MDLARLDIARRALTLVALLATSLSFAPNLAECALRIVPDQYPTIQSAFNAAASDDSIMVRAGTYVESLAIAGKNVTLFGESGQGGTFLTTNGVGRVFTMGIGVTQATILSDVTIRDGRADDGGGILLANGASPVLRRCRLVENTSFRSGGSSWGGGIRVGSGSQLLVEDCTFDRNVADYFCCFPPGQGNGGAISAASGSSIRVVRSTFRENGAAGFEGGFGGALEVGQSATAIIEDCFFQGNGGYGGGVGSNDGNVTIERCVFTEHVGYSGAAVGAGGGRTIIRSSLFFDNLNWGDGGVVVVNNPDAPGEFSNNTVAFNDGRGGVSIDSDLVRNNIIANNEGSGVYCDVEPPGVFTCNDVWGNTVNYGCTDLTGIDGNISLNPLFCNVLGRDLHIDEDSPCAPGAGPCGLMGALGVGCGVSAVEEPGASAVQPLRLLVDPNPISSAGSTLTLIGDGRGVMVEVINAQGRIVERIGPMLDQRIAWRPGVHIPAGVYFARIEGAGTTSVTKFAIVR
jgi:hypothetical protein